MFTHTITVENEMYKIEFFHDERNVKTVYVNANSNYAHREIIEEIAQFHIDVPDYMKKQGYIWDNETMEYIKV